MENPETLVPLSALLIGWMIGGGSPGPATLAISSTSMQDGQRSGLVIALGILFGSACWGVAAGLGFSAVMMANAWLFEGLRYFGAAYLLYLAVKSLRSAWQGSVTAPSVAPTKQLFVKGALLHLTNPKAILSWGAIYAIALPSGAGAAAVWTLFVYLFAASCVVFCGYALLFSSPPIARGYRRAKRLFDGAFGVLFGFASLKILTAKLA
ncbi:MAG: LysE family translocator [Roseobacter sp.]